MTFKALPLDSSKRTATQSFTLPEDLLAFDQELDRKLHGANNLGLSVFETKKLHDQAYSLLKQRRTQLLHASVKDFKDQKDAQKQQMLTHEERVLEARREDASKVREISKIIQNEQKTELDKNMQMFLHLNREERNLRKELVEKQ